MLNRSRKLIPGLQLLIAFLLISLLVASCSENKKSLVGHWESTARPYNLGTILIFDNDSSFTQIKEARVNYTYKLIGDTLISASIDEFTGKEIIDSAHVTISGDKLVLVRGKIGDQQETVMKRYDSIYSNSEGIVGFWKWPHRSGKEAISEYHPDGKVSVSVLIEKIQGNYFINGDSLTVFMMGSTLRDIYFQLKDDSVFFPDKFAPLGRSFVKVNKEE
jgi:hypothetical protein